MYSISICLGLLVTLILTDFFVMKSFKRQIQEKENDTLRKRALMMRQEFSANVTHELKSPLHLISAYSEIIANGTASYEEARRFALKIHWESQKMKTLIDDVICLSRLDESAINNSNVPGKGIYPPEPTDILEIINCANDMVSSVAEQRDITIIISGNPLTITTERKTVCAIVFNVFENAVKYSNDGGNVIVDLRPSKEYCHNSGLESDGALITISDNGIGIAPEDQSRVFERFYRADKSHSRKIPGTGLGLAIVEQGVNYLDGNIRLESTLGEGTHFELFIPDMGNDSTPPT